MPQPKPSSESASGSRSRSACYACRARKQKCDGNKPVCSRCRSLAQTCSWPRSQKRGPAKGYIEALEIRLKETERMLWRILATCQQENLTAAFSSEVQDRIPQILSVETLSTTEEKKSAIAFWEQFPLHTAEDVLVWKEQVENPSSMEITSFGENQEQQSRLTNTPSESQDHDPPSPMDEDKGQSSVAMMQDPQDFAETSSRTSQAANVRHRGSSASVSNSGTTGGKFSLSKEFQDTFLW